MQWRFETRGLEYHFGEIEPGNGGAAANVKHTVLIFFDQVDGARGQGRCVGGRADVVLYHADRLARSSEAKHELDKVAAVGSEPARTEYAARAHDQRLLEVGLCAELTREFRNGVGAERMRRIVLAVRALGRAIEDVVGRKVHQLRIELPAGERQVAHSQSVGQKRRLWLFLGDIHLVIGRRIDHQPRIEIGQDALYLFPVGDVNRRAFPACNLITTRTQLADQFHAKLSATAEYRRSARHKIRA